MRTQIDRAFASLTCARRRSDRRTVGLFAAHRRKGQAVLMGGPTALNLATLPVVRAHGGCPSSMEAQTPTRVI